MVALLYCYIVVLLVVVLLYCWLLHSYIVELLRCFSLFRTRLMLKNSPFTIHHSPFTTHNSHKMEEVQLHLNEKNHGHFFITDNDEQIAEMQISISANGLTVYHTEVSPKYEGHGLAKKLLTAMVDYARKNKLKVIPLCPYVHAQFKRHPEEYNDVWKK